MHAWKHRRAGLCPVRSASAPSSSDVSSLQPLHRLTSECIECRLPAALVRGAAAAAAAHEQGAEEGAREYGHHGAGPRQLQGHHHWRLLPQGHFWRRAQAHVSWPRAAHQPFAAAVGRTHQVRYASVLRHTSATHVGCATCFEGPAKWTLEAMLPTTGRCGVACGGIVASHNAASHARAFADD